MIKLFPKIIAPTIEYPPSNLRCSNFGRELIESREIGFAHVKPSEQNQAMLKMNHIRNDLLPTDSLLQQLEEYKEEIKTLEDII